MMSTVFVVDDDAAVRAALARLLETAGMRVETYADGPALLAACEQQPPGCVVLDMAMPGMNGHEVQAALNELGLGISIVFLTGHGDVPMAVEAVQAGAVDFLEKPVQGVVLLERVHRALAVGEERREAQAYAQAVQQCHGRLSSREREVMALVVSGLSSKEIARQLGLSPRTVEAHRSHVMDKMGATSLAELVNLAAYCKP